jgi:hypothetical protein
MIKVSADKFTKTHLGLDEELISDSKAREVVEKLRDNKNYKLSLGDEKLIIQRFIRD